MNESVAVYATVQAPGARSTAPLLGPGEVARWLGVSAGAGSEITPHANDRESRR